MLKQVFYFLMNIYKEIEKFFFENINIILKLKKFPNSWNIANKVFFKIFGNNVYLAWQCGNIGVIFIWQLISFTNFLLMIIF